MRLCKLFFSESETVFPADFDSFMPIETERMFEIRKDDANREKKIQSTIYFMKECLKNRELVYYFYI